MKKEVKPLIYAGIILAFLIFAGAYFFVVSPESEFNESPGQDLEGASAEVLEKCQTLANNNGPINILFFSDGKTAEEYYASLLNFAPFNPKKESFNFYYIDPGVYDATSECEIYKGIALLCYSNALLKKASSCPNDYIIVVDDRENEIRSSSYMNVMSINSAHPLSVFAHEFGHAFANFAEEYVPAKIPKGTKNCVSECSKFGDLKDNCFQGCSREDYSRSTENGVMRTLDSETYGEFNERLIGERISESSESVTGRAIEDFRDCEQEAYYLIESIYGENGIEIIRKEKVVGCAGGNGFGNSNYDIFDEDGNLIRRDNFNSEFIYTDVPIDDGGDLEGEVFVNEDRPFILRIPVFERISKLKIESSDLDAESEGSIAETELKDVGFSNSVTQERKADGFSALDILIGTKKLRDFILENQNPGVGFGNSTNQSNSSFYGGGSEAGIGEPE